MKTLTLALCELLYLKKPSRIPSRSLTSQDNSRKRSHFSKPRVSRQWPGCNLDGKSLRNFLQPPQQNSNDADFGMGGETTLKSMENNSLIEGAHEEIDVTEDKHEPDSFKLNRVLLSGLKFAVLFGLLSIQGSQQAAATEFTTGIQPLSYIGDLGDISTGFSADLFLRAR